jgi:ABC-type branched-subunit amino acid transport system substrate-binding protein
MILSIFRHSCVLGLCALLLLLAGCGEGPKPRRLYSSPEVYQSIIANKRREAQARQQPQAEENAPSTYSSGDKIRIALLVPLSGSSTGLGEIMLNAAELALFDIGDPRLEILPFDTQGSAHGAKTAVTDAVQNNVRLILGPIYSEEAEAAAPIAARAHINMIAFSNNRALAEKGVFLLGFMPEQQIERVLEFAMGQNMKFFSALVSDDEFGRVSLGAFKDTLSRHGQPVSSVGFYSSVDESLSRELKGVDEAATSTMGSTTPTQTKTHALLVPEGGRSLLSIASRLYRHGMHTGHIRLLGSGQWDDPLTLQEPKLAGSWFATSPPRQRELFEEHYREVYGHNPVRIASLAYDGIALAALLAQSGDFSKSAIQNSRGFSGVNGVFRFKGDGTSERALSIIEVTPDGFKEVDPAPTTFDSGGFSY